MSGITEPNLLILADIGHSELEMSIDTPTPYDKYLKEKGFGIENVSIFNTLYVLKKYQKQICISKYISNDKLTEFTKQMEQINYIENKINEDSLEVTDFRDTLLNVVANCVPLFYEIRFNDFLRRFEFDRTIINKQIQTVNHNHRVSRHVPDAFAEIYPRFQKQKRIMAALMTFLKNEMLSRSCNCIYKKVTKLQDMYQVMVQTDENFQELMEIGKSTFRDILESILHLKALLIARQLITIAHHVNNPNVVVFPPERTPEDTQMANKKKNKSLKRDDSDDVFQPDSVYQAAKPAQKSNSSFRLFDETINSLRYLQSSDPKINSSIHTLQDEFGSAKSSVASIYELAYSIISNIVSDIDLSFESLFLWKNMLICDIFAYKRNESQEKRDDFNTTFKKFQELISKLPTHLCKYSEFNTILYKLRLLKELAKNDLELQEPTNEISKIIFPLAQLVQIVDNINTITIKLNSGKKHPHLFIFFPFAISDNIESFDTVPEKINENIIETLKKDIEFVEKEGIKILDGEFSLYNICIPNLFDFISELMVVTSKLPQTYPLMQNCNIIAEFAMTDFFPISLYGKAIKELLAFKQVNPPNEDVDRALSMLNVIFTVDEFMRALHYARFVPLSRITRESMTRLYIHKEIGDAFENKRVALSLEPKLVSKIISIVSPRPSTLSPEDTKLLLDARMHWTECSNPSDLLNVKAALTSNVVAPLFRTERWQYYNDQYDRLSSKSSGAVIWSMFNVAEVQSTVTYDEKELGSAFAELKGILFDIGTFKAFKEIDDNLDFVAKFTAECWDYSTVFYATKKSRELLHEMLDVLGTPSLDILDVFSQTFNTMCGGADTLKLIDLWITAYNKRDLIPNYESFSLMIKKLSYAIAYTEFQDIVSRHIMNSLTTIMLRGTCQQYFNLISFIERFTGFILILQNSLELGESQNIVKQALFICQTIKVSTHMTEILGVMEKCRQLAETIDAFTDEAYFLRQTAAFSQKFDFLATFYPDFVDQFRRRIDLIEEGITDHIDIRPYCFEVISLLPDEYGIRDSATRMMYNFLRLRELKAMAQAYRNFNEKSDFVNFTECHLIEYPKPKITRVYPKSFIKAPPKIEIPTARLSKEEQSSMVSLLLKLQSERSTIEEKTIEYENTVEQQETLSSEYNALKQDYDRMIEEYEGLRKEAISVGRAIEGKLEKSVNDDYQLKALKSILQMIEIERLKTEIIQVDNAEKKNEAEEFVPEFDLCPLKLDTIVDDSDTS